jgi:DNA-binding NarL/FixJ family response regulator
MGAGTRVMIVGTRLLQQGLAALLGRRPGFTLVGECEAPQAAAMASARSPEVVLMESATGRPGLSYVPAVKNLRPSPRVVVIGRGLSRDEILAVVALGVDGCVSEEGGIEEILEALDAVRWRERYLGPLIADGLQRTARSTRREQRIGATLTPRERQVLAWIARGRTGPEIARLLGLSPKTVHAHRTSIMTKLGVHSSVALVRRAIRLGLADV